MSRETGREPPADLADAIRSAAEAPGGLLIVPLADADAEELG